MSTAVAAAAIRAERRVVQRLRESGATNPGAAFPLTELSFLESRRLRGLLDRNVVQEPRPGFYSIDEPAYDAFRIRRRKLAFTLLVGIFALAAFLLVLTMSKPPVAH